MRIVVFVEVVNGEPLPDGLAMLEQFATAGHPAEAVVGPCPDDGAALMSIERAGAAVIHVLDDPGLRMPLATPFVSAVLTSLDSEHVDLLAFSSTTLSVDVATALAFELKAGVNFGLDGFEVKDGAITATRVSESGSEILELGWRGGTGVALFRRGAFVPSNRPTGNRADIVRHKTDQAAAGSVIEVLEVEQVDASGHGALAQAEVIVSAGRGMGGMEGVDEVRELAEALGGQAGASLAAVERGWAPHSMQVGQTGTVVRPRLYIACGISGQIQHRVGMERSATIVSINTDEDAPLNKIADLVVVGDARAIVPALTSRLRERAAP